MKTLCFSPVYNQIQELPRLLDELRGMTLPVDHFVFVNNGSSDGSEALLRESEFEVIEVERNRGVGYAILVSLEYALEHGYDVLAGIASNGKMLPAELPRVLDPIRAGEADYVTGSRFLDGGASPNLPGFRRRAIPWVNHFAWLATGARLTDATCGYRAYCTDVMRRAQFDWRAESLWTYGLEYYLYAKALLDPHIRCLEVPITMRYPQKGQRYSKIRPGRDWVAMLKPWLLARVDGKGFAPPAER